MHGLGNDFLVMEAPPDGTLPSAAQWRRLADRHSGVGFDQALVLEPARAPGSTPSYRIFNADGGEVEQCGNGARCLARYLQMHGRSRRRRQRVDGQRRRAGQRPRARRRAGRRRPWRSRRSSRARCRSRPRLPKRPTPLAVAGDNLEFGAVSIGNPHAVLRVDAIESAAVERIGRALQAHPSFPRQVNVGFMQIIDAGHIRLRVYERGAGETMACGTGACAAVAVGRNLGLLGGRRRGPCSRRPARRTLGRSRTVRLVDRADRGGLTPARRTSNGFGKRGGGGNLRMTSNIAQELKPSSPTSRRLLSTCSSTRISSSAIRSCWRACACSTRATAPPYR